MAGLPRATLDQFTGGDVKTNAALLYDVLTGIPGARREIVLLNAAAALVAHSSLAFWSAGARFPFYQWRNLGKRNVKGRVEKEIWCRKEWTRTGTTSEMN